MDAAPHLHSAAATRAQATAQRVHGVTEAEATETPYIGLVTRLIAFAIDAAVINGVAILVGAVISLVSSVLPASKERDKVLVAIGGAVFVLWMIGYFVAFWTTTGQTVGNRLMEIRVVREDGSRLRPRHAVMRLFGIVISWPLLIGFLPILYTARRRGVPDWLAGTVVIAAPRPSSAE